MSRAAGVTGCSDHNCIWGHPGGMGTNGGCRCEKDLRALPLEQRRMIVLNAKALRAEVEALSVLLFEAPSHAYGNDSEEWLCRIDAALAAGGRGE